jgi:hypothetical protein
MHNAPPVDCPVGRSVFECRILGVAMGLWSVSQTLWWWHGGATQATWWCSLVAAGVLVFWQRWRQQQADQALLRWTGADWVWFSPAYRRGTPLQRVVCRLDFQRVLLLQVESAVGLRWWVWLEAPVDAAPGGWSAVRRAVHAARPHR